MTDENGVSEYLTRPKRTLEAAQFETARERGRLALKTWQRAAYLNLIESRDRLRQPILLIDDWDSLNLAALAATEAERHGVYIATVVVSPEEVAPLHLVHIGEAIAARARQEGGVS